MLIFTKSGDSENKDLYKLESQFILLRSIHFIIKPTIRGEDLD
jgi:hypothetical protein